MAAAMSGSKRRPCFVTSIRKVHWMSGMTAMPAYKKFAQDRCLGMDATYGVGAL